MNTKVVALLGVALAALVAFGLLGLSLSPVVVVLCLVIGFALGRLGRRDRDGSI